MTLWIVLGLLVVYRVGWALIYPEHPTDFDLSYHAAEHLIQGENPYPIARQWFPYPLFYPLPAVLLAVPFTALSLVVARPVFAILTGGLLAYALWRYRGPYALLAMASGSVILAVKLAQPTPLLTAAILIPGLGFLLTVKPNLGLALWLSRPSRSAVIGGALLLLVSLVVLPPWPWDWWEALQGQRGHIRPPILRPFGWLLLLSALRWRAPEGRLLLAMALVPQTTLPYELVPLALIPRNGIEMGLYVVGTWLAMAAFSTLYGEATLVEITARVWPTTLVAVYLPMLYFVLRPPSSAAPPAASLSPPPLSRAYVTGE